MQAFKCPNCGGDLKYDAAGKVLSCSFCGTKFTKDEYRAKHPNDRVYRTNELVCPQCGAALLSYDDTIASFCSFCGSSVSFTKRIVTDAKPDGIMPFSIDREQALEAYRDIVRKARFVPDWMLEQGEDKLVGIYMPYYSYSGTVRENISTEGSRRDFSGVKYIYDVNCDVVESFSGIRFDAAEVFPDFLSESIDTFRNHPKPVNPDGDYGIGTDDEDLREKTPEGVKDFDTAYLAGYYADGGNVKEDTYTEILERILAEDLRNRDLDQGDLHITNNSEIPSVKTTVKKILYPVWLNTHRNGDRICYSVINGQDGKAAAEIPVDRNKYLKWSVILAAVLYLLLNQIWTVKPLPFLAISAILLLFLGIRLHRMARNVWLRQAHLDDAGFLGPQTLLETAEVKRSDRFSWVPWVLGILTFIGVMIAQAVIRENGNAVFQADGGLAFLILPMILGIIVTVSAAAILERLKGEGVSWSFNEVPSNVSFSAWWRLLLGMMISAVVLLTGTVHDEFYYIAGVINLGMAIWTAFDLIQAQNQLNSRPIPLFSRKRGGEKDA